MNNDKDLETGNEWNVKKNVVGSECDGLFKIAN